MGRAAADGMELRPLTFSPFAFTEKKKVGHFPNMAKAKYINKHNYSWSERMRLERSQLSGESEEANE